MSEKRFSSREIWSWFRIIAVSAFVAFIVNNYLIVNAKIPSGSMENTIETGDRVIASRLSYLSEEPQRGDIVIFQYPIDKALGDHTLFIKRIIGLPGETVVIRDAEVYIDGSDAALDEPYLKEEWVVRNDGYTFHVPDGYYLMLGDNRNSSSDSRRWAEKAIECGLADSPKEAEIYRYVAKDEILGKACFRYWPLHKISVLNQ